MLANLRALFGVIADILLLRRGPEHLPASNLLLAVMIGMFLLVDAMSASWSSVLDSRRVIAQIIAVIATLAWFHFALILVRKRERFTQLLTGFFVVTTVFTPVLLPIQIALTQQTMAGDQSSATVEQPSLAFLLLSVGVIVWAYTILVRMVRSAFEWHWFPALLLLIGKEMFTAMMIFLAFGGPDAAATE